MWVKCWDIAWTSTALKRNEQPVIEVVQIIEQTPGFPEEGRSGVLLWGADSWRRGMKERTRCERELSPSSPSSVRPGGSFPPPGEAHMKDPSPSTGRSAGENWRGEKNKAGRRPGFADVYADQIWYFSTLSGREAASMERLITKLIFSFSEKASSQPRKATSASGDLSFTSL